MSQQSNFQKGVNFKATTDTASCGEAERGETKKQQENFNWTKEKCTEKVNPYPDTTRQSNFWNGK